jgi:hypothetical protein
MLLAIKGLAIRNAKLAKHTRANKGSLCQHHKGALHIYLQQLYVFHSSYSNREAIIVFIKAPV